MSVKVLVDMNLSPDWVPLLERHGWSALHWSVVGDPRATDRTIMDWAASNGFIVFTHDLDFGTALALTHASGPSVLQIRGEDVLPDHMESLVIAAIRQHDADLAAGALVVVDESKCRVRSLPINGIFRPPSPRNP
jgi:predicted nuclease of predicted toxin-antitoxin system